MTQSVVPDSVRSTREYQICTRCIMDTSDPLIRFDHEGVCNHCRTYERNVKQYLLRGDIAQQRLAEIVEDIKAAGRNRRYDCLIGLSGGVDSTYVAYQAVQLGLRPLAIHVDNGWDTEIAQENIRRTVSTLRLPIEYYTVDKAEFRDLLLAFLRASVPDLDIPTDHAIVSVLYQVARKHGIKYFLSGANLATESHLPKAWSTGHRDWKYVQGIHKLYGHIPLKHYPHHSLVDLVYFKMICRLQTITILDYLNYNKAEAMKLLQRELGWEYYGGKHYENVYTRFVQGYILPTKFGFDKRRQHLSTLICSGQISREQALEEIKESPYPSVELLEADKRMFMTKLGLDEASYNAILSLPNRTFWDYPSYEKSWVFKLGRFLYFRTRRSQLQ